MSLSPLKELAARLRDQIEATRNNYVSIGLMKTDAEALLAEIELLLQAQRD